jgi:hypothetical protein
MTGSPECEARTAILWRCGAVVLVLFVLTPTAGWAQPAAAGAPTAPANPTRYEVLLSSDGPSPDVLYSLGTAYAERGDVGKALWALERARLAAPGDGDVAHNLDVVRQRVRVHRMEQRRAGRMTEGEPDGVSTFRTLTAVTAGTLAWPSLLAWIAAFGLLFWRRGLVRGGVKDAVTVAAVLFFVVAALGFGGLAARTVTLDSVEVGVAVDKKPTMRRAPIQTEKRGPHPDLFEGATLRVLERRDDGWIHVQLVDGARGWMHKESVGLVF